MKNADLKLPFDHTDVGEDSTGISLNTQPGFRAGVKFDVFSLVIDFVFLEDRL